MRRWTDEWVAAIPYATDKERVEHDPLVARHRLVVTRKRRKFEVQGDRPKALGPRRTFVVVLGYHPGLKVADARMKAGEVLYRISQGEDVSARGKSATGPGEAATLATGWTAYREALQRREASPRTLTAYEWAFKNLAPLHDVPLRVLSDEPHRATDLHTRISTSSGKVSANLAMRLLSAVYNHARKAGRGLPQASPTSGISYHKESVRERALSVAKLPAWNKERLELASPLQKEIALWLLLSGMRKTDTLTMRWADVNIEQKTIFRPNPKGGAARAFYLPLSQAMIDCLARAKEAGQMLFPAAGAEWVWPGPKGHLKSLAQLSYSGHELRHSFAGLALAAGVDNEITSRILNHSLGSQTAKYQSSSSLLMYMIEQMERISTFIISHSK